MDLLLEMSSVVKDGDIRAGCSFFVYALFGFPHPKSA